MAETRQAVDETVEATMKWRVSNGAPDVILAYPAFERPDALFAELKGLGWGLPPAPLRPASAIEWVPDPEAGTEFTILPWRVTDVRLLRGQWSRDIEPAIGALTYDALSRHGVVIHGSGKSFEKIKSNATPPSIQTAAKPAKPATPASPATPATPATPVRAGDAGAPLVIAVGYEGGHVDGLVRANGLTGGRKKVATTWVQSTADIEELCPSDEERVAFFSQAQHAWTVEYAHEPTMPGPGQAALCAVIPGCAPDEKKLTKFLSALGDSINVAKLTPLDQRQASSTGVLVRGVIAANSYDLVSSNLRMRFPAAVVRLDN